MNSRRWAPAFSLRHSGEARMEDRGLVTLLLPCFLPSFINDLQNFRRELWGLHRVLDNRGAGAPSAPCRSARAETDSALVEALIKRLLRPLFAVSAHQRDGGIKDEAPANGALIFTGRARVRTQLHLVIRGDAGPGRAAQPVCPPEHHFLPRQLCPDLVKNRAEPRDLRLVQPLRRDHELGGAGARVRPR